MFKSDSVRDLSDVKRGPGPAFYKKLDEPFRKKILNHNPSDKWF